jgi:hypothetical protein
MVLGRVSVIVPSISICSSFAISANYQKNIAAVKTPTEPKPQSPATNTED